MEHSYSRDTRPNDKTMATRTVLVHKPPPCPSCHSSAQEMDIDIDEASIQLMPLPQTDEQASKEAMDSIATIAAKTKNRNLEEDDWEELIDKVGWTVYQLSLFAKVADILSLDRLARLTHANHPNEPVLRRASIDKAVQRMRKAFAVIHWDLKLTQWLHGLMVDNLPVSYVTAYMDILQTLRAKVPSLVDKMVQGRSNELLEAVIKPPWDPVIEQKDRRITPEPIILLVPSGLPGTVHTKESRETDWIKLLNTITPQVQRVKIPENFYTPHQLPLADYMEQLVTLTRTKLHEIRKEYQQKQIILVGFNVGSALALQVASLEQNISCVVCLGFSTSTMRGSRGNLDDRLVELQTPALFVVGQNATRTSQEQIEALREQMISPTALVVVGSADDCLQVTHAKRRLEQVTQSMVNSMVMDEVAEFVTSCISNPPSPAKRKPIPAAAAAATIVILDSPTDTRAVPKLNGVGNAIRKHKAPVKVGRVTKKKLLERSGMAHKMSPPKKEYAEKLALSSSAATTSYEIVTGKIKQDVNMRQVVDGGFIQISNESTGHKWQVAGGAATGARSTVMLPVIQKQKISLGNQFTPMRTPPVNSYMVKESVYSVNSKGKKTFALQSSDIIETIELDTDEEIVNIDGDTVLGGQFVDTNTFMAESGTMQLSASDISGIPVVFQDRDGNIQEPLNDGGHVEVGETIIISSSGVPTNSGVIITSQQQPVIPRPNKFIYYKPQQAIISKTSPAQYVVLSNVEEKRAGNQARTGSSKPLIISVESLEKGTPNTVYHVVDDSEKEEYS